MPYNYFSKFIDQFMDNNNNNNNTLFTRTTKRHIYMAIDKTTVT